MDMLIGIFIAVILIVVAKFRYKNGPFKEWHNRKPKFVWLPKYVVKFECPPNKIYECLTSHGFERIEGESNIFKRGKMLGDFSAKHILLHVEVIESEQCFKLAAGSFVLFDTGDLWAVCSQILAGANT